MHPETSDITGFIIMMTSESRLRIDEFLPDYDFGAAYEIEINATPTVVYERLLASDFYAVRVVRLLMFLRTGRRIPRKRPALDLRHRFEGTGFVTLAGVPCVELVIGVAGKFWRPNGGRYLDLRAEDFVQFSLLGYAKAALNFVLRPEALLRTVLSTATRIKCCDRAARWKFRLYWAFVGPFSGVIRKAILQQIKAESEATAKRCGRERIA
jgi:hypothetical protein